MIASGENDGPLFDQIDAALAAGLRALYAGPSQARSLRETAGEAAP